MKLHEYEIKERQKILGLKLSMLRCFLELSVEGLAQEAELTPEELIDLEAGNIQDFHLVQVLYALGTNYGVNLDRFIGGDGKIFSSVKPGISFKFYKENTELFDDDEAEKVKHTEITQSSNFVLMGNRILNSINH